MTLAHDGDWTGEHVTVDDYALHTYATQLAATDLVAPDWRMPIYPAGDDATFVQFIGVQNALNFCFTDPTTGGKFAVDHAGVRWSGAMGLCAALLRARESGIDLLDTDVLATLDLATAERVFASDEAPITLLPERVALLNSLAGSLRPYHGSFADLFAAAGYDAATIIATLTAEFPAYATDRYLLPGTKDLLVYDKRARLLPLMYEGRARTSGGALQRLENLDAIGPVVDYQLPRALRDAGVLRYSDQLAAAVDNGALLAPGSEPELALRSVTHAVVDRLTGLVNDQLEKPVTMVEIDFALWFSGRKAGGRHHLTLTTAY